MTSENEMYVELIKTEELINKIEVKFLLNLIFKNKVYFK